MPARPLVILAAGTLLIAGGAATAAPTFTARFLVSVRATVTKQWSYTTSRASAGCRVQVSGSGTRRISLLSGDVAAVTARWAGTGSRVRFSGSVAPLTEKISQVGTKVTRSSGSSGCEHSVSRATCVPVARTLHGLRAQLVSRRAHRLSFRRMGRLVPDVFFNGCPGEPRPVRAVVAGLALADTSFSERDLFDRSVGGFTLAGTADATTTLLNGSGRILHRVRWTLTLRRVGG